MAVPDRLTARLDIHWITACLGTSALSAAEAQTFWAAVTATQVVPQRGGVLLQPAAGDAVLAIRVVDDPSERFHLHLEVDDREAAIARARNVGGRPAAHHRHLFASPGGLVVGLGVSGGRRRRPQPVDGPGGRSLLDQICIDARPGLFESEAAFWCALTGWERRRGRLPEFEYLARPDGMPFRLLLQRLGAGPAQPVTAHVDFACDDVDAQVRRHLGLGAVSVRRTPYWATMRDPAGREYCLTARRPDTGELA